MSIEQRLEDLTKAINELPNALAAVLANSANPLVAVAASQTTTDSKADPAEEKAPAPKVVKGSSDDHKSDVEVAGRKTYVFDKTTKTGQIIEKGEELPQGDNYVRVGKTKWEELAGKYDFDVETGKKVETNGAEDFDDLEEEAEEEGEQEESGSEDDDGDDMDLGLDEDEDEGELDPTEVKKRMVRVMREVGREDALKLFKKVGARNFDEVKKEDLPKLYDMAGKVLKKAGN